MNTDLNDLIAAWHGFELDEARLTELMARLREDHELRAAFVAEVSMYSRIKVVRSASPRWLKLAEELGVADGPPAGEIDDESFAETVMERLRRTEAPGRPASNRFRAARNVLLAAAALAFLTFMVSKLHQPPSPPAGVEETAPASVLAVLTGSRDVKWESSPAWIGEKGIGQPLTAGSIRAASGSFSLSLVNGVTLSAEAPVHLEVISADNVRCLLGKVRVHVPPGAEGFTVDTPNCAVVDRGTDFAVNVNADHETNVMVFEGMADVLVGDPANRPLFGTSLAGQQAVKIGPEAGSKRVVAAKAVDFTSPVPPEAVPLDLSPEYAKAVLASGPWGYWRFEGEGNHHANEIQGGPAITGHGNVFQREAATANRSMVFAGNLREPSHLKMDGVWPRTMKPSYAVELWFEAENFGNSTLLSLLGTDIPMPHNRHAGLIELRANNREPGGMRFLHRWPAGTDLGVNISSARVYLPCRWTHLVAQCDGERLQVFLDGALVSETSLPLDFSSGPVHVMLGRLYPPGFQDKPENLRLFRGGVDEFALYDRPLSPEEIRAHYEAR